MQNFSENQVSLLFAVAQEVEQSYKRKSPSESTKKGMIRRINRVMFDHFEHFIDCITTIYPVLKGERHCLQNEFADYDCKFTFDYPGPMPSRLPYYHSKDEVKTILHFGQLKLFLSTVLFLSRYAGTDVNVVVYAGAAPGMNIAAIASMFPKCFFILYDPMPFDRSLKLQNVECHTGDDGWFTDAHCKKYAELSPLFISDIRRPQGKGDEEDAKSIREDMEMQLRWVSMLNAKKALLKFRLPWTRGTTTYVQPDAIWLQPFVGPRSTELRAVVDKNAEPKEFDHTEVEEYMFHFNTQIRPSLYPNGIEYPGFDHCWDCTAAEAMLGEYIDSCNPKATFESIMRLFEKTVNRTTASRYAYTMKEDTAE